MEREQSETWGQSMTSERSNFSLGRVKANTSPTCALPHNHYLHFNAAFASLKAALNIKLSVELTLTGLLLLLNKD